MASGEKFERHRQPWRSRRAQRRRRARSVSLDGTSHPSASPKQRLETATSPADRRDSDRIDVTGFTPVTGRRIWQL